MSRLASRDNFASYNGTAPIEYPPRAEKVYRLSRRGNRRLNHAIHMAAVTQIRYRHTNGRAYYDKKLAEGKTSKEALRALKRQISDAIFACLQEDARRAAARTAEPGGQPGNHSATRAAQAHTPTTGSSGKPLPGLPPTLRPLLPFPRRCHLARARGRVQDRAQPGRVAAPGRASSRRPPASR